MADIEYCDNCKFNKQPIEAIPCNNCIATVVKYSNWQSNNDKDGGENG